MKNKKLVWALPIVSAGLLASLAGCGGTKSDVTLTIYNWEDYIYEGTDDEGNLVDEEGGIVKRFETYYKEKTGKTVKVNYECFSTNEIMYSQIKGGSIEADLICPSDYMIQKMANEGMLQEFSYDESSKKYSDSLENWDKNGSPYIKDKFANEKLDNGKSFLSYAVPYFWGTLGFTYRMDSDAANYVDSWECLWNSAMNRKFSIKNSMRDTYVAAIFHVYKEEIENLNEADADYNEKLSAIFNRCDADTLTKVETALRAAKANSYGLEIDEGKDDIVRGTYSANLAWSGDAVYSIESAEESGVTLGYSLPEEGSNIWFDGWCMPKGGNKELAEEFVNFVSDPKNAALSMDSVGYTSSIAGEDIWALVNEWYAAEDGVEADECDLSYFFGDTIEGAAKINIDKEERGRGFDAQYPSLEQIKKCCVMKDFGAQTAAVEAMWNRVTAA